MDLEAIVAICFHIEAVVQGRGGLCDGGCAVTPPCRLFCARRYRASRSCENTQAYVDRGPIWGGLLLNCLG